MDEAINWLFWLVGGSIMLAALALLAWSLFADRPKGRRRCPQCWYDLSGSPSLTCSECGHVARRERALRRTRRHWRSALLAGLLLSIGYETSVMPRIMGGWKAHRWRSAIPTTALLLVMPWQDSTGDWADSLSFRTVTEEAWSWQRAWYARSWESRYQRSDRLWRPMALHAIAIGGGPAARGRLPTVLEAARDQDATMRASAAYAIGMILGDSQASIPALVVLLGDTDEAVRQNAAWALWKFGRKIGRDARAAAPALTASLDDQFEEVRMQSAMALSWIAEDPGPAIALLTGTLDSTTPTVAVRAALAFFELDPRLEGVLPALIKAARHSDAHVRLVAVGALVNAGPRAADAVPVLTERLTDRELNINTSAAAALGNIGPAASSAIPELRKLLIDPQQQVQDAARDAMQKISPGSAGPAD